MNMTLGAMCNKFKQILYYVFMNLHYSWKKEQEKYITYNYLLFSSKDRKLSLKFKSQYSF